MTCIYMPVIYGFSAYMGNPYMGRFCMAPYLGQYMFFFSNKAVIKIDMNLHKNVTIPIFTSFIKLQLDFTKNFTKITIFSNHVEHCIGNFPHTDPPCHHPTTLNIA